jgi:hypothetical protein
VTVLLYGVLPDPADVAPPAGVRALATPAGVAWVRTLAPGETPSRDEQRRTLSLALSDGTPVPARAGTRFDDDAAVMAALGRTAEIWRAALERVRDHVEMMVFVPLGEDNEPQRARRTHPSLRSGSPRATARGASSAPSAVSDAEHPGRAYLERLRARLATADVAEAWRARLRSALGALAADDAVVADPSGRGVLVSHLVPRAREGEYRARVAVWAAEAGVARAAVVGPWAPFSFVTEVGADDRR